VRIFSSIFLIISSLIFLAHYILIGQAVYGDGRFYYSYGRSLALQGNLDVSDELTHVFSPKDNNQSTKSESTSQDYPVQSIGPALVWSPILFIAHQIALITNLPANGYSDIYQITTGLFSILFTALAFHRLGLTLLKKHRPEVVFVTLILLWAGTNLFFYTALDNINTHFLSFSLAALSLSTYLGKKTPSFFLMGLIAGLAFTNRQMDLLFHAALLGSIIVKTKKISSIIQFSFAFVVGSLPQLFVWYTQRGSFLPPMAGSGFWNLNLTSIWDIFFNLPRGLLFTAPVMLLALLNLPKFTDTILYKFSAISFIVFLIINSFWWSPLGGAAYGPRFLIVFYPFLSLSLADLISRIGTKYLLLLTPIPIMVNLIHIFIFLYKSP